ncbi:MULTISPECIES: SDR family oxidoreductase [unclassified Streptomyces]|uniref:SDR family oxidoreductase n=1 Tax=unclassified Streptomyces TaxID=2593676 RepID=UPI002E127063|nr:SDR family oxidoreductase [Streptomyces sp. NBC_01197]WSS50154.1 SDR family oxidoreductase [Streptomyces sp. NBC_01180]
MLLVPVEELPDRVGHRVGTDGDGDADLRSQPGLDSDDAITTAGSTAPLGRFGTAEEAAASALFLMANNYVTGQIITVDGGETLA